MKAPSSSYILREQQTVRLPAELYKIWKPGTSEYWYHTSGDEEVVYDDGDGSQTYVPATIYRDVVTYNSTLEANELQVKAAYVHNPVIEFLAVNPIDAYWIKVMKVFRDLLTGTDTHVVVFIGQIRDVAFKGNEAVATCVGFEYYLRKPVLRYRYQITCNNALYDDKCGLNAASWGVSDVLTDVSSTNLILQATAFGTKSDGWFTRGYVQHGSSKSMIVKHSGTQITLRYPLYGAEVGNTVTAYAGCNFTKERCLSRFNNLANFFGTPYIPLDNPATRMP